VDRVAGIPDELSQAFVQARKVLRNEAYLLRLRARRLSGASRDEDDVFAPIGRARPRAGSAASVPRPSD
jgi:hypothetical protein